MHVIPKDSLLYNVSVWFFLETAFSEIYTISFSSRLLVLIALNKSNNCIAIITRNEHCVVNYIVENYDGLLEFH